MKAAQRSLQAQARLVPRALATLVLLGCSGPDNLTEPILTPGDESSAGAGNSGSGNAATNRPPFDWGATVYDGNQGAAIDYQDHYNGSQCLGACHDGSTFNVGGTLYEADGTTFAANRQVGILANGTLYSTYAGTQGNFYATLPAGLAWPQAQIAIRGSAGDATMPLDANASGNCNGCHGSARRLVAP